MPSETVVFQSFRTQNVPHWIGRCLETAKHWAQLRGYDYHFLDDRFFDYVPQKYRAKTDNKILLSDFARLIVSRELLSKGYARTVWIDADVVVFDPDSWHLPTLENYYFSHELWPTPQANGVRLDFRANNAVMVFSRGNSFLDFYIDSCHRILSSNAELKNWHIGVRFLTGLRAVCPLPLLMNIGMLGQDILADLVRGPKHLLSNYIRAMGEPLVAANLCGSVTGMSVGDFVITDKVMEEIVEGCIATKGQILNQYLGLRSQL
jgi:hypothetical protein